MLQHYDSRELKILRHISLYLGALITGFIEIWAGPLMDAAFRQSPKVYVYFPLFVLVALLIITLLFYLVILTILKSRAGRIMYNGWRRFKNAYSAFCKVILRSPQYEAFIYEEIKRGGLDFKKDMESSIEKSNKIYFLLLSSYTMCYDPREQFILEKLKNLSRSDLGKKEIKILLLDRDSKEFEERGKWFVNKMNQEDAPFRVKNYKEYYERCAQIEKKLKELLKYSPKSFIRFYKGKPRWRLHIFDEVVFVPTYRQNIDGHLTPLMRFSRNINQQPNNLSPVYHGFYLWFNDLIPRNPLHNTEGSL